MLFVYFSNIFRHIYFRRQKFSFQTHTERKIGAENRRRKMESLLWSRVYGACVMGLRQQYLYLWVGESEMRFEIVLKVRINTHQRLDNRHAWQLIHLL